MSGTSRPDPPSGAETIADATLADATIADVARGSTSGTAGPGRVAAGSHERGQLSVSLDTNVGRVRHNNEDYVAATRLTSSSGRSFSLWIVADGVGGGPQGERASKLSAETLIEYLTQTSWTDPARAFSEAYALANRRVYELSDGAASTTTVAALVDELDGCVYVANVGDSRAYLVAAGTARPVTDDHSIVAVRVAAGQLTPEEARRAPDRNVLTRSVGSEKDALVDVFGPRALASGERLLLCTDGVHGMIDEATLARLASTLPIGDAARGLVLAAVEAGGRDNATALIGGFVDSGSALAGPLPAETAGAGARTVRRSVTSGAARRGRLRLAAAVAIGAVLIVLGLITVIGAGLLGSAPAASPSTSASTRPPAVQSLSPAPTPAFTPAPTHALRPTATATRTSRPPTPAPTGTPSKSAPTPRSPTPFVPHHPPNRAEGWLGNDRALHTSRGGRPRRHGRGLEGPR
jgi:serine/threonine protein phosphatase PrpC